MQLLDPCLDAVLTLPVCVAAPNMNEEKGDNQYKTSHPTASYESTNGYHDSGEQQHRGVSDNDAGWLSDFLGRSTGRVTKTGLSELARLSLVYVVSA